MGWTGDPTPFAFSLLSLSFFFLYFFSPSGRSGRDPTCTNTIGKRVRVPATIYAMSIPQYLADPDFWRLVAERSQTQIYTTSALREMRETVHGSIIRLTFF